MAPEEDDEAVEDEAIEEQEPEAQPEVEVKPSEPATRKRKPRKE